jgi:hypothetical protein
LIEQRLKSLLIGLGKLTLVISRLNEIFFLNIIIEQMLQMLIINTKYTNSIIMKIHTGIIVIMVVIGNQEKSFILNENEFWMKIEFENLK